MGERAATPRWGQGRQTHLECDQRDYIGSPVADDDCVPHRRALRAHRVLHGHGRHVLAAGRYNQLLAAARDPQAAAGVDAPHITRAQRPVGRNGRLAPRGIAQVSQEHVSPGNTHLAAARSVRVRDGEPRAGHGTAGRPRLEVVRQVVRGGPRALGQAVHLGHRHAEGGKVAPRLAAQGRSGAEEGAALVQAQRLAHCAVDEEMGEPGAPGRGLCAALGLLRAQALSDVEPENGTVEVTGDDGEIEGGEQRQRR